jgi:hypothetical protein
MLAQLGNLRVQLILALVLVAPCLSLAVAAQQTAQREIIFPVTIRWNRQKGVSRYRLQIATDERFQDVFLDRRVTGDRLVVNELSSGYYYWRVAPAESQLREFSRPIRFFISGGVVIPVPLPGRATRSHSLPASANRKAQPQRSLGSLER